MKKCPMKIVVSIVVATVIMIGLCACSGNGVNETTVPAETTAVAENTFMAGYAAQTMTPDFPVPLTGYGNEDTRISTGKLNDLYVIALAVRDTEGNTAVMVSADLMINKQQWCAALANWVQDELGIPASNVIFSSIHQHSTPDLTGKFGEFAEPLIKQTIKNAVEDLAPAEMYINTVETKALSFVRHYWNAEGKIYTPNHGSKEPGLVSHESESDKQMQLLKFARSGDKKDIVVVNFQAHPYMSTSIKGTQISSDWVGVLRQKASKELDCNIIYFSGAGGNLADKSEIQEENKSADFKEHGERAAKYIIDAEDSYVKVETGPVKVKKVTIDYDTDSSMNHLVPDATKIYNEYVNGDFQKAKDMAEKHPDFYSVYHAQYVVLKGKQGPTRSMTISAISIGDVAFTAHPYEMYDTNGMELKNGTVGNENYAADQQMENPYKMTIITTIANGYNSYIPSKMGYENGGYSTDITYFAAGTGEIVVTDYLKILNELYG